MLKFCMDLSPESKSVNVAQSPAANFPYSALSYGHFIAGQHYVTARDNYPYALILYTISGKGMLTWHGQTKVLLPNQAVAISCEEWHEYRTLEDEWTFFWIHCGGEGLKAFL